MITPPLKTSARCCVGGSQGQPEEISSFRYPDRPTFFQKKGVVFRWLVAATPFFCNASLDCMSSVGVYVSVTRGASTILRERLLRIPDTCSLKDLLSKIATDASGWVWLRKDGRGLVIVCRPTDLQLRETVGIPETRYFFWLAQLRMHEFWWTLSTCSLLEGDHHF